MSNLINSSFFVRNLTLPNLASTSTGGIATSEKLTAFINQYEPKCLLDILGYHLYKLFKTEVSARMTNLKNGAEYVDECGNTKKWLGLVHDTDISLIANYIYFYIQQTDASQTTGINTSISKGKDSLVISPMDKMVNAWRFFSEETYDMISFLWNKKDENGVRVYPEFTLYQYKLTKSLSRPINIIGI